MKIAITGGAGFIGTELAVLLKEHGHEIVLIDLKKSTAFPNETIIADVTDRAAMIEATKGADAIFHLAAEHRDDVKPIQKYYDVNVGGAENIVAAANANNIKTIVFTSSVALYGLNSGDSKETDTPDPFNDYGRSKWQSEKIFESWGAPGHRLVMVRLVATFGPGNRGNIYNLMAQIAANKFLMVGSGRNKKSIAYVRNVAAFLNHCLTLHQGHHLYNYADKPDLSMNSFVSSVRSALGKPGTGFRLPYMAGLAGGIVFDIAAKLTGKTFPVSVVRVKKFCADTVVNADKAKGTGFIAPFTIEDGLRAMIEAEFKSKEKGKKILYVINHAGWFWSHRLPLALAAREEGWNVHVAVHGAHDDRFAAHGFTAHELPKNPLRAAASIRKIVKQENPALVHAITLKYAFLTGLALKCRPRTKRVFTIAGLGYLFSGDGIKPRLLRLAIGPFLKSSLKDASIIVQNPDDRSLLIKRDLIKDAVIIRGSGVDTAHYHPAENSHNSPCVLLPARLVREKGISVFTESARILRQRGINARFVIAGGAADTNPNAISKSEMENLVAGSGVEWLGHVDNMAALYQSATIVAYPSYYREGVPKVLLEAAACGKPIVTTDHPGCREVVAHNDNGLLVPVKDAAATADAIEKLLLDPDLRTQMGKRGRTRAENEFDVRIIVRETLDVYRRV